MPTIPRSLTGYAAAYAWHERFRADCARTIAAAIDNPNGVEARTIDTLPRIRIAGYGTVSTWHRPALR